MGMKPTGNFNPKSIYEVLEALPEGDRASSASIREADMLKAYSKKYKARSLLVNNTHFSFDEDGYCYVPDVGNNRLDFELLLKKNHVEKVLDEGAELQDEDLEDEEYDEDLEDEEKLDEDLEDEEKLDEDLEDEEYEEDLEDEEYEEDLEDEEYEEDFDLLE